jgi:hypothetical protein
MAMTDKTSFTTPTLRLVVELIAQARQLIAIEISLTRAELTENVGSAASGAALVAVGAAFMLAGLVAFLAAVSAFLVRLGAPLDVACLIVAIGALIGGLLLMRWGGRGLQPRNLLPARSLAQLSSLFGER